MKRLASFVLMAALTFAFSGCGGGDTEPPPDTGEAAPEAPAEGGDGGVDPPPSPEP